MLVSTLVTRLLLFSWIATPALYGVHYFFKYHRANLLNNKTNSISLVTKMVELDDDNKKLFTGGSYNNYLCQIALANGRKFTDTKCDISSLSLSDPNAPDTVDVEEVEPIVESEVPPAPAPAAEAEASPAPQAGDATTAPTPPSPSPKSHKTIKLDDIRSANISSITASDELVNNEYYLLNLSKKIFGSVIKQQREFITINLKTKKPNEANQVAKFKIIAMLDQDEFHLNSNLLLVRDKKVRYENLVGSLSDQKCQIFNRFTPCKFYLIEDQSFADKPIAAGAPGDADAQSPTPPVDTQAAQPSTTSTETTEPKAHDYSQIDLLNLEYKPLTKELLTSKTLALVDIFQAIDANELLKNKLTAYVSITAASKNIIWKDLGEYEVVGVYSYEKDFPTSKPTFIYLGNTSNTD